MEHLILNPWNTMPRVRRRGLVLLALALCDRAAAQGLPPAISASGSTAAMAMAVQGTANAIPIASADPNNAAFLDWQPYAIGTSYTGAQLAGVRAVEINITNPGNLTFTSATGNSMTLPYAVGGAYNIPIVPARIDLGQGTAATAWMLR